jgi:hypothetical protein
VPFHIVENLDEWELLAYCVTFGGLEGGKEFDWGLMKFIDR